jgi:hypothetical protein
MLLLKIKTEFSDAQCSTPEGAYCTTVRQNAPIANLVDIAGNIEVDTNADAICGITVNPQNLTFLIRRISHFPKNAINTIACKNSRRR